jgi:hypothetical protein
VQGDLDEDGEDRLEVLFGEGRPELHGTLGRAGLAGRRHCSFQFSDAGGRRAERTGSGMDCDQVRVHGMQAAFVTVVVAVVDMRRVLFF